MAENRGVSATCATSGAARKAELTILLRLAVTTAAVQPERADATGAQYVSNIRVPAMLCGAIAAATAVQAAASPAISIDSMVFVEKTDPGQGRRLEPAGQLNRGDRLVYVVRWYRMGGNGGFVVTNPLPRAVHFQASANGDEEVSVDGGKTWGRLSTMRIGTRFATPEDVTHVRWRVDPVSAARGSGRIAYSAIVR